MADLSITVANVEPGLAANGALFSEGTAGGTITAGQPLYIDSGDSDSLKPCDADVEASADAVGIALHAALDGQPIEYQTSGPMDLGATLTVGAAYYVSDTAGGVKPAADLAAGEYVTLLGVASAADVLEVRLLSTGAQVPA